ncbi:MAG: GIY-YIG nuclease family protein [Candidatus Heimdallarchaeaceae archaeon]
MKGTYLLFIKVIEPVEITIKGKSFFLSEGHYFYIGSAFGAGGLSSRLHRHLRRNKKKHWHIDQLTMSMKCEILGIGVFVGQNIECSISKKIAKLLSSQAIIGFGNSDCKNRCKSHLYYLSNDFPMK